ncbi:MAG TPA: ATP-binding protein [Thermodesulfovibrionales bacterium]|nr:ATP-binding protein [Thermodesulfovibrionales bacterium]
MVYPRLIFNVIEKHLNTPEAVILTGMRRTGKTTLLNLIRDRLKSDNKLFLDLENPLNRKYFEEEDYERIKASLEFLGISFKLRPYIFLDEIQHVRTLPSVVKYFIDHYKAKFFLTGSASYYLKNLFTESLAGRKAIFEVFPLTFREFLGFKKVSFKIPESENAVTAPIHASLDRLYEEYMRFGGFPEIVLKEDAKEKEKALEDVFTSFFQLEVLQLGDFRRNDVIRDLMLLLMQSTGSKLDIQRISRDLKVSRPALYDYLAFLEGTYFIKTIRPFSKGRSTEVRKMPKVYVCDAGMANYFARLDEGHIFECSVFQNLRVRGELNYYQRKSGVEIDFILDQKEAYEVKINPSESDMRKIKELSQELGIKKHRIVSIKFSQLEGVTYAFML